MSVTSPPGHSPADVARKFAAMVERSNNLQPILAVAAEVVRLLIDDGFRSERTPDGVPWAAHAQRTIDARRDGKGQKTTKIGVDTGLMRNSVSAKGQPGAPAAGPNWLAFGTNRPYAAAFHSGAQRSGSLKRKAYEPKPTREAGTPWTTRQPARPFLPITPDGALMTGGPAGVTFTRISRSVGTYITTGAITGGR